jgi:hypothetical protein
MTSYNAAMLSRDTVSFWLAIYASILATTNSVVSVLNHIRDRRKVRISFRRQTEYLDVDGYAGAGES